MDTQVLSYLEPFIAKNHLNKLPKDISDIFGFISKSNVNIDPIPYIYENSENIHDKEKQIKIFDKLKAYEVLRVFNEKNIVSYEKDILDNVSLFLGTDALYSHLLRLEKEEGFVEIRN